MKTNQQNTLIVSFNQYLKQHSLKHESLVKERRLCHVKCKRLRVPRNSSRVSTIVQIGECEIWTLDDSKSEILDSNHFLGSEFLVLS